MSFRTYGIIFSGGIDASMLQAAHRTTLTINQVRRATEEMGVATERAGRISRRAWRLNIFGAQMGIFYLSMFTSALFMRESALLSVQDAEENYQRVLREYGPAHERTRAALRRLERAQRRVQMTTWRTALMFGGMILQAINLSIQYGILTIGQNAYTASVAKAAAADAAHTAVIWGKVAALKAWVITLAMAKPWLAAAMIAAGAVVAGAIGYYIGRAAGGPAGPVPSPAINIEVHARTRGEIEEAIDIAARRAKEELRSTEIR